jgi:hypothetical protein
MKGFYETKAAAEVAVARKRKPSNWMAWQNLAGKWIVVLDPAARKLSLDAACWSSVFEKKIREKIEDPSKHRDIPED